MKGSTGSGKVAWDVVGEWQSKETAKGLVEMALEVCRDADGPRAGYAEHAGKLHVHTRITPPGRSAMDYYHPVDSREAGEALIASRLAAI